MASLTTAERPIETVACVLCGIDDARERFAANLPADRPRSDRLRCTDSALGEHGRIVQCRRCGLAYTSPREVAPAILEAYEGVEDETYVAEEAGRVKTFIGSLKLLHRFHRPPGRLLDVGAYTGLFLHVAKDHGWTVEGIEPSRWACAVARERYGVQVTPGTTAGWRPEAPFDVVTMWDVLEHYTDPLAELRRARELLRPGGTLALTTIDLGSPIAALLGPRWWWMMEMHLYYFTHQTVRALLERAGFGVLAIRPHVRIVSVRYLWTRVEGRLGRLARVLSSASGRLSLNGRCVPIVLGDLMTVIARARKS